MPAAGRAPADGPAPRGLFRGPGAQGPKAHTDLLGSELVGGTGHHPDKTIEHIGTMAASRPGPTGRGHPK